MGQTIARAAALATWFSVAALVIFGPRATPLLVGLVVGPP
jgi:hypothetical protein